MNVPALISISLASNNTCMCTEQVEFLLFSVLTARAYTQVYTSYLAGSALNILHKEQVNFLLNFPSFD